MNTQIEQHEDELVDLGAVSVETKGIPVGQLDTIGGNVMGGISNN